MPAISRDGSRDRDMVLRHQRSFGSESGRLSVPMWDSSDPERAPPPLPLNPIGHNASPTRPNASATIAAAAQALAERARESMAPSPYVINDFPGRSRSPEKSPTKAPQHKRLQSLQSRSTKELKASFENNIQSQKDSPRPVTPSGSARDMLSSSPERMSSREATPTPVGNSFRRGSIAARSVSPTSRRPVLTENTPPSGKMLSIKSTETTPLADISNMSLPRPVLPSETLQEQMHNLTAIAASLQKEMSALSRRSKDNASDLLSLKEATNTRDKDIRDSLKELIVTNRPDGSRSTSSLGLHNHLIDAKPYNSAPITKSISLPRIPSMHFDAMTEQERPGSPSLYTVDGAASLAMLEKIIREMVTKEGQERLLSNLSELLNKSSNTSTETAKRVEELVEFIKEKSTSQALIRATPEVPEQARQLDSKNGALTRTGFRPAHDDITKAHGSSILSDELVKMLQRIKDSVTHSGGLTGEVKLLVRELRGEVLGMGRELGRKLDAVEPTHKDDSCEHEQASREELGRIVQEGLSELKEQMDQVIQARRRQSSTSAISRSPVDNNEVYAVVKHALSERGLDENPQSQPLDQQAILNAVREAYEAYKPEIELQQFGLERDEILQCLKEGLEDYQANKDDASSNSISRDEILSAVQEGLQYFNAPTPVTEASEIKEEVLMTVRECLESFRASISENVERGRSAVTREDVSDAVRAELGTFKHEGAREVEINSQDLYNAVKAGLETMDRPLGEYGDQVLTSLHTIVDGMRNEFKEYSAASGRDTEQILDALKDGLERLRAEIESYVDRAQDVTGKDEIIDTLKSGLETIQASFDLHMAQSSRDGGTVLEQHDVSNLIKAEFEQLHGAFARQKNSVGLDSETREDIVNAIAEGLIAIKHDIGAGSSGSLSPEVGEAIKDEIENLRTAILAGTSMHKDELLDTLHDSIGAIHSKLDMQSSDGASTAMPSDDIIAVIREEFDVLRDVLGSQASRDISDNNNNEDLLHAVKESMDTVRMQIASDQNENTQEHLSLIKEELELIRNSLTSNLLPSASMMTDKSEIIGTIREGLAELHEAQSFRGTSELSSESTLEVLREELENLRQSIASTVTRSATQHDSVEIIDTIRLGLDDLRSDIERKLDNPERFASSKTEILEALTDGLDSLRADISNIGNKPVDMTVSYEILETLKTGLAGLRDDFGKLSSNNLESRDIKTLSGNEIVLAEPSNGPIIRDANTENETATTLKKDDLEKMEVMLTHLQIKVEAMDQNMQSPPSSESSQAHSKANLEAIDTMLRELQSSVEELALRETQVRQVEGAATKEDIDAVETLLQNTKAKVEEVLDTAVTREQIEAVEASLKLTGESVDTLSARLDENLAAKVDLTSLEILLHGATTSLSEMKELVSTDRDKAEFEFVQGLCVEIKDKVAELPKAETVSSKEEMEQLSELIRDFKTSYEIFKERYETDISITAKAFDDRKEESKEVKEMICALKDFMEESTDTLKTRINRGSADVRAIDEILESIEEKIEEVPKTSSDIHELLLAFKEEFEKAHEHLENIKGAQEENSTATLEKQEEMKDRMVTELAEKLEERFAEFVTRQDDHYLLAEQTQKELAEKVSQQEELLSNHKAMAEDLRLTIDTLGATITGITPALADATEKMDDDSRTVFGKIDDVHSKLDSHFYDFKTEHEHTRGEVAKSLAAVTNVQQEVTAYNPKAMELLSNLLKISGDHFEHSKKSQETSFNNAEKVREEFNSIKSSFAALPVPRIEAPPVEAPKYDDSKVHSKLDQLLSQSSSEAQKPDLALNKLDQMHRQIVEAASQLSGLIAAQRKAITDEHDFKASEAKEASEGLAKCVAEKGRLEGDISSLRETKETLIKDVKSLKVQHEGLSSRKTRLSAEVSSLETALSIRREELQMMDARAEALERRIMDRVMDHSRALLIAKTPKSATNMNLKRVTSNVSQSTASTTTPTSVISASTNMALKARPLDRKSARPTDPNARRILSLSQITNNVPTGAKAISPTPRNITSGLNSLKRSQSVKNPATRKASWAGRGGVAAYEQENSVLEEMDNENDDNASHALESEASRSASYTGTEMSGTNARTSYGTGASEYSYETGSYITGTDIDRRSSCGSTIRSNLNGMSSSALEESIYEDKEHEDDEEDERNYESNESHELKNMKDARESYKEDLVQQAVPLVAEVLKKYVEEHGIPEGYDSGLGSDLPTVELSPTILGSEISDHSRK